MARPPGVVYPYTLDWGTFDADTEDYDDIKASSIDYIQDNMDLIHSNLANITNDTSVLTANYDNHCATDNAAHDGSQKTTEYTNHDTTHYTNHDVIYYTSKRVAEDSINYTNANTVDKSSENIGVNSAENLSFDYNDRGSLDMTENAQQYDTVRTTDNLTKFNSNEQDVKYAKFAAYQSNVIIEGCTDLSTNF